MCKIGIDLMGSDASPEDLFLALSSCVQKTSSFHPVVFATDDVLKKLSCPFESYAAEGYIAMDDDPIQAIQNNPHSSLSLGLQALARKEIHAFVSAGNTGALLVGSKAILNMLPGIERPALLALLPTKKEKVAVLDVGANICPKAKHLLQFAHMGIAYQKSRGIQDPKVGLLNIGRESSKGTSLLQEAYEHLKHLNHNKEIFLGNVEGREVFEGHIDVLVTEGFSGNIFLKTAEGTASFILSELEKHLPRDINDLKARLHYTNYPGAILCGVEGIIVKCHGEASAEAFINSIQGAISLVKHTLPF